MINLRNDYFDKLDILYAQFKEYEETSIMHGEELKALKDRYVAEIGVGSAIARLQYDLLHTLADLWYEDFKQKELE